MGPGVNRREALVYGGASLFAGLLGRKKVAAEQNLTQRKIRRLIYLWGDGGLGLADFIDPKESSKFLTMLYKPDELVKAPGVDGLKLTKPFGALARVMKHVTVFKTRVNNDLNHDTAIAHTLRRDPLSGQHLLTNIAKKDGLPYAYAESPNVISSDDYRRNSFSLQLGYENTWGNQVHTYSPPWSPELDVVNDAMPLLETLESLSQKKIQGPSIRQWEDTKDQALYVMSHAEKIAFSLPEKDMLRYSNGERPTQGTLLPLLARELIRRKLASVVLVRMGHHSRYGAFDMHENILPCLNEAGPRFSHSIAALIDDWLQGQLPDTALVFDTEFGRKPYLNDENGRDHYYYHPSFIVSEETNPGVVIGKTNEMCVPIDISVGNEEFADIVQECVSMTPNLQKRLELPAGVFR